jgi:hypothetical protein
MAMVYKISIIALSMLTLTACDPTVWGKTVDDIATDTCIKAEISKEALQEKDVVIRIEAVKAKQ